MLNCILIYPEYSFLYKYKFQNIRVVLYIANIMLNGTLKKLYVYTNWYYFEFAQHQTPRQKNTN